VVLVLGSVLVGAKVVSGADRTYSIVALEHDLSAGKVLAAGDLTTVDVRLPGHGRGTYVQRPAAAVGKTLRRDVSAGELLAVDAVAPTRARTTVTVPLADGAAPDLRAGRRVEVWLSTPACPSVVLIPDVTVQSVRRDSSGSFSSGSGGQDVVISVDSQLAARVIAALSTENATLRAGVLTGAATVSSDETSLPDLATCVSAHGK